MGRMWLFWLAAGWLCVATAAAHATDRASGEGAASDTGEAAAILVTTASVVRRDVEVWLDSMGKARSRTSPTLAAEVDGRVEAIHADTGDTVEHGMLLLEIDTSAQALERDALRADIQRFEAQIANEARRVERLKKLSSKDYVARTQLDDAAAQLAVYSAELKAAQARLAIAEDKIARARVQSHVDGEVEQRHVSVGDFVRRGDPLLDITEPEAMQVWLPLPETVAGRLARGQPVVLSSPLARDVRVEGRVDQLQPTVGSGSRAVTAIVDVTNPGPWRPGTTVNGRILVDRHQDARLVPAMALVRRPAGEVVYLVRGDHVEARTVRTGQHLDGLVEIVDGLDGGETVAVEGAAWLTDGAKVRFAGPGE
jgi:RND family efflux transporter MFP subunit